MASRLIYAAFFVSGFTALLYEIVWQRLLVRITGATMEATVATFSLFMLGLALGAFFSIKYCEKSSCPLKTYALAELLIAALGLIILYLCDQSSLNFFNEILPRVSTLYPVRSVLVIAFSIAAGVAMTIATALMSVAFNCGLQVVIGRSNAGSRSIDEPNLAYVLNLAGATLGSVGGAFVCLPVFGLTNSAFIACAVSLALALMLWSQGADATEAIRSNAVDAELEIQKCIPAFFFIFAFSFIGMSLEITWTRLLCLLCGSSTYAVGSVLAAILVSLTVAAFVIKAFNDGKNSIPFISLAGISGCAALVLSFNLLVMPYLNWSILLLQGAVSKLGCPASLQFFVPRILMALGLICGSTFYTGMVTPLLIKALNRIEHSVRMTAYAMTASTVGSILGALFTAFVVIPNAYAISGIETSLISSTCLLALLGVLSIKLSRASFADRGFQLGVSIIGLSSLILALHPQWQTRMMSLGPSFVTLTGNSFLSFDQFSEGINSSGETCIFYKESESSTVTVETNKKTNIIYLKSNGKIESALPLDWRRSAPTSDYRTQLFLGITPVLYFGPKAKDLNALAIGFGSGITSGLLLSFDKIAHLTTCEIEPTIYKAAHFFDNSNFAPLRKEWLDSGRVKPECVDARAYLNQNNTSYSLIVSQPSEPWISGSSDLFTLEFFRLAQSHLKSGGVFVQWLQLYCIDERLLANLIATFERVFPDTYVLHPRGSGDIVLIGVMDKNFPKDFFQKNINQDLSGSGMSQTVLATLKAATPASTPILDWDFILTPDDVVAYLKAHENLTINTDGRIATEYELPQELLMSEENISQNIVKLKTVRARQ